MVGFNNLSLNRIASHTWIRNLCVCVCVCVCENTDTSPNKKIANATEIMCLVKLSVTN